MGIKDFTKVFLDSGVVTLADLKADDLAVDAFFELFRSTSMQHAANLTNPKGENILYLNIALANAVKRKVLGCNDIWCWDSRDPRDAADIKSATLQTRKDIKEKNLAELATLEKELAKLEEAAMLPNIKLVDPDFEATLEEKRHTVATLKARNPDVIHFSKMITNVQYLLEKLGIRMIFAPVGVDAEAVAAQLCKDNVVDGVLSADTDALAYGATKLIKKIPGKSGKYHLYRLEDILNGNNNTKTVLTQNDLVKCATALGCDFCDKTPGIGEKTVIKKVLTDSIKWTPEQIAAQKQFLEHPKITYDLKESKCTQGSLDELREWLVKEQGFGRDRIERMLKEIKIQ